MLGTTGIGAVHCWVLSRSWVWAPYSQCQWHPELGQPKLPPGITREGENHSTTLEDSPIKADRQTFTHL
jgi:hypothetical protein